MGKDVIIALDFPTREETFNFLDRLLPERPYVKVGMELFYKEGPAIIHELKERGLRIFLDLKLHDIPHTVAQAMHSLKRLDIDMVNVHAAGTIEMMRAAKQALGQDGPLLIAVTQLTSTDEKRMQEELLIPHPLPDVVATYAKNTKKAGLDGVVCSPQEAHLIHEHCGTDFLTITPGVRFEAQTLVADDQVRVMTPARAKAGGADYIVVGRPITQSADPLAAYHFCVQEFVDEM
ncbi:orotidine-5'-phosphate decarboxylase [Allofustis seminis]|uniref:orotidine-5'-phosphate decarboxylase n=1 Tax=Allofustis seminis TaxID=166939 RepID=UPI000365AFDA|nr:orotidine-5'-phosphate decarboxylase [Allofustis seminis]